MGHQPLVEDMRGNEVDMLVVYCNQMESLKLEVSVKNKTADGSHISSVCE